MADHSLESLLQINKDGIRNKLEIEIEIAETFFKKHLNDLKGPNNIGSNRGKLIQEN